jgi:predicted nucleic acid-binding protein
MLVAVVDTNVVVSGILAGDDDSPLRRIVDAMLRGELKYVLSEALLAEYRRVLLRPAIVRRHRLTTDEVDVVLEEVVLNAAFRGAPSSPALRVPAGDEHIGALLAATPGAVLVTGDRRLADTVAPQRTVLTPAELAASLT